MNNKEVAKILYKIADILEVKEVQWKPRAYRKAAQNIESLNEDVKEILKKRKLENIPGVGKHIALKIEEILKTGKLQYYQKLKKKTGYDIEKLMNIPGLGPHRIKLLHKKLKIKTIKDLQKAAKTGKISKIKGLGKEIEKGILEGIAFKKKSKGRLPLGTVLPIAREIIKNLKKIKEIKQIETAGSLKRMKETIRDIDLLVSTNNPKPVITAFINLPNKTRITSKGTTRASIELKTGIAVDLRVIKNENFGAAQQYFTGNKQHNIETRKIAIKKGYKLSEYGLFKGKKTIAAKSEKKIYSKLGLQYIPPELRENAGELELAKKRKLPTLIKYSEIKADFQMHTKYSDGTNTIKEMTTKAKKIGHKYIGITDHISKVGIANPMNKKRFLKYLKEIDKTNFSILKGAEVDINKEGNLIWNKKDLTKLDYITGSIHTGLKTNKQTMTKRLINAMNKINILGHPTNRRIGKRKASTFNYEKVFQTAKDNNVFIEINGSTDRMDPESSLIKLAKEIGCKFVLSTDAHNTNGLWQIELATSLARRGWLEKKDVLNTKSYNQAKKILNTKLI